MSKITNKQAASYAARMVPFKTAQGSIFAEIVQPNPDSQRSAYVVYSYGRHWPMYIYIGGTWFENEDRYSVTTSKQMGQARPAFNTIKRTVEEMREMAQTAQDARFNVQITEVK